MSDINKYNNSNMLAPPFCGDNRSMYNLEAHTTSNMKLERPKVSSADFSSALNNYNKYSHLENSKHLNKIDNDIYKRAKKEKREHEFNFKRYFTIFGILGLLTAAFAYFRRGKG